MQYTFIAVSASLHMQNNTRLSEHISVKRRKLSTECDGSAGESRPYPNIMAISVLEHHDVTLICMWLVNCVRRVLYIHRNQIAPFTSYVIMFPCKAGNERHAHAYH